MEMSKLEKVIEGLEDSLKNQCCGHMDGVGELYAVSCEDLRDAISLLKEQEAKPMTEYDDGWDCPRCGLKLVGKTASGYPCDKLDLPNDEIVKYCPVCGQAVKWDE